MEDLFTQCIHKPIKLYKGSNTATPASLGNNPTWFALSEECASEHGEYIHEYTVGRLRLLDISHPTFHQDFMFRVNNGIRDPTQKALALIPLGLPTFDVQMKHFGPSPDGVYDDYVHKDRRQRIAENVGYFGNHHRYSLVRDGVMYDMHMVDAMKRFYPYHNGYVCRVPWPSYHHGAH